MALQLNTKPNAPIPELTEDFAAEVLGLIPMWVNEYNFLKPDGGIIKWMGDRYGYSLYEFTGTVNEDGSYSSPYEEDEDLQPIAWQDTQDGVVYYYNYGITALPVKGGHFVTRMD